MRVVLITLATIAAHSLPLCADTFVYLSDSKEHAIKIFRMHDSDGTLQQVDVVRLPGSPGSLAADPGRQFLFASIRSTSSLASFAIDASSGRLRPINSTSLAEGANAAYVATDRQGRFLLSASYSGARVAVHAIASDGKLAEQPVQVIETAKTAHSAVCDQENRLVFVPHVTPNAVYQFRFDSAAGRLMPLSSASGGREHAGPRHLALHPSGKFAFTSDEQGSSVTLYALDSESGLKPLQTLSTLPTDFSGKNTTADVKVHPSGRFVWVSNRGHDSLAGFRFDETQQQLRAIGQTPTEKTPRSFDLDPSGRFLYSGGEGSGKLAAYRIDADSGELARLATYPAGTSLSWVAVIRP